MSTTLHIEHDITDYPTWRAAFDRFSDARTQGGVTAARVRLADDDPHHIVIDLDFEGREPASAFATFLHERVWGTGRAPALAGTPTTRLLVDPDARP
ncbi:hypothetical protein [Pseudactinotalea terrae]|uniref:hypothetical protein n=1 Tax=Pseudactinotalea terrae TaxID=1743262 RepID=UPI0012E30C24|nr:hypothetical protein [Pseudactinotalea terrae]